MSHPFEFGSVKSPPLTPNNPQSLIQFDIDPTNYEA
jgi:hypothetical protein